MKKMKVSILALSALAGGILAASAANTITYRAYNSWMYYTNADAKIWSVSGGPETGPGAIYPQFSYTGGSVSTDASGKVSGYGQWVITYNTNGVPFSVLNGTISGKMAGKIGSPATVTLTINASGFTADGVLGYSEPLKANLKFTGQPGINLANTNAQAMVGTVTGTFTGKTPQGDKNYKIPSGRVSYISSSSFTYAYIDIDILQSSKGKMQAWPWSASSMLEGTGTIKSDTSYKLSLKGVGWNKGVTAALSGNIGLYTNSITTGTNVVSVPFLAPKTGDISKNSKIKGQAIQGSASTVHAWLEYDSQDYY